MKIAVIGAGIGGMAAAYDLQKNGHSVTLFEASDGVGGLARGFKEPEWDWTVERFYHHWFLSDSAILGLIRELDWQERVVVRRPVTVMYSNGQFYPFDSIPAALLYPGLGWGINKVRFGLVGLYLRLTNNWKPMEHTTVDAWMRKYAGDKVFEEMWEPMLIGKFGSYAKEVNMAWMWARLHGRTTKLATYEGGFQAFANQFAAELQQRGISILQNTAIQRIEVGEEKRLRIYLANGQSEEFDQCLVTSSPAQMAIMVPQLPLEYLQGLLNLKSLGAVVLVVSLKEQLSREGHYWFNLPKSAGFPFLALVEHTNFLPKEHFGGDHIIYCGDYLETDHEYFSLSEEELLQRFLPSFQRINPDFKPDWVKKTWLFRTAYAQPVPLVDHSRNIPEIRTPLKGLYFASMSQVYPWDRGTNFAVQIARQAAGLMQQDAV